MTHSRIAKMGSLEYDTASMARKRAEKARVKRLESIVEKFTFHAHRPHEVVQKYLAEASTAWDRQVRTATGGKFTGSVGENNMGDVILRVFRKKPTGDEDLDAGYFNGGQENGGDESETSLLLDIAERVEKGNLSMKEAQTAYNDYLAEQPAQRVEDVWNSLNLWEMFAEIPEFDRAPVETHEAAARASRVAVSRSRNHRNRPHTRRPPRGHRWKRLMPMAEF